MTPSHAEPDPAWTTVLPALPRRDAGGLRVLPFRAVRYTATAHPDLSTVIAPPYDVIDELEHRRLEAADVHNVVRLILPREPSSGIGDRYAAAAELYRQWLADDVLAFDDRPALYLYRQTRDGSLLQSGLFAAVGLEPLDSGVIFPHEKVRPGPVEDRLSLMRAMRANPEPILLVHNGGGRASAICEQLARTPPVRSTTTSEGISHQLWAITDPARIEQIQNDLSTSTAMIADGHHRYTTYSYLRSELAARVDPNSDGSDQPWDFGLALLVDLSAAAPDVQAIHRVIPGLPLDEAIRLASPGFRTVETLTRADAEKLLAAIRETDGHAFAVTDGQDAVLFADPDPMLLSAARPTDRSTAWWALDASVASAFLLASLWRIGDVEGELEAEHDPVAAVALARELGGVAVLLKPPPLEDIIAVALAGDTMPRKSTLFGPKPRSGLVLRSLNESG